MLFINNLSSNRRKESRSSYLSMEMIIERNTRFWLPKKQTRRESVCVYVSTRSGTDWNWSGSTVSVPFSFHRFNKIKLNNNSASTWFYYHMKREYFCSLANVIKIQTVLIALHVRFFLPSSLFDPIEYASDSIDACAIFFLSHSHSIDSSLLLCFSLVFFSLSEKCSLFN